MVTILTRILDDVGIVNDPLGIGGQISGIARGDRKYEIPAAAREGRDVDRSVQGTHKRLESVDVKESHAYL